MIFYIKDRNDKLYATCKFIKDSKQLVLEKSSFIKKTFNCSGCNSINKLRSELINDGKLQEHNDDLYLLNQTVTFTDINAAVCLVLGGKLEDAETLIKNEFGESIKEIYTEVFK